MAKTPDVQSAIPKSPTARLEQKKARSGGGAEVKGDLEDQWKTWNKSKSQEDLNSLMTAVSPLVDRAVTSYAPNGSPAIRSKAKVLARQAFDTFDPKRGFKLNTHLYQQLQPLRREYASYNTLHVPERIRFDLNDINDANNRFVETQGYEPSDEELADHTGISVKRIRHVRTYSKPVMGEGSFGPKGDDDEGGLEAPSVEAKGLWQDYVYQGLGSEDKRIYDLKTGKGGSQREMSVTEIAKKLKLSPSAISQRLSKIDGQVAEGAKYGEL